MCRVHLIVEGQTEESFVKTVLAPYLGGFAIYVDARAVETGRKGPARFRGGMTNYAKAKRDISTWLAEDQTAYVSTMFDLYRLPQDFPGFQQHQTAQARQRVVALQQHLSQDINNRRFVPYIQLHEFEALLFSVPAEFDNLVPGNNLPALNQILAQFNNDPELINDSPQTAPSKRLEQLYPRYDKVAYGTRVADRTGLPSILGRCTHFRQWVDTLKGLVNLDPSK